jgi:hypothetical protein
LHLHYCRFQFAGVIASIAAEVTVYANRQIRFNDSNFILVFL